MALPMTYVRKKPKGYGRNARIEGVMTGRADTVMVPLPSVPWVIW